MPSEKDLLISLEDGKYKVYDIPGLGLYVYRHNEPWRDIVGDNFILALIQELQKCQELAKVN